MIRVCLIRNIDSDVISLREALHMGSDGSNSYQHLDIDKPPSQGLSMNQANN